MLEDSQEKAAREWFRKFYLLKWPVAKEKTEAACNCEGCVGYREMFVAGWEKQSVQEKRDFGHILTSFDRFRNTGKV